MNETIDSSFPIDKYFDRINDWFQFANDDNTPYTAAQFIHKAHHVVLASGIYIDVRK